MTSKLQAQLSGIIAGLAAFVSWLATVPPEQQSAMLGPIVACLPLQWRPAIGLWMRALATFASIWGIYKAAHSGPQTPPKNPPTE